MNYETLLREHNLKATPQRVGILTLMHNYGHINVEDMFLQIKENFPSISLATLYKNIHAMVKSGLVTEVKVPQHKSKYELTKEPHAHLLCDKCDEFLDIACDLESLMNQAGMMSGYKLQNTNLVFSGLCKECQKSA